MSFQLSTYTNSENLVNEGIVVETTALWCHLYHAFSKYIVTRNFVNILSICESIHIVNRINRVCSNFSVKNGTSLRANDTMRLFCV